MKSAREASFYWRIGIGAFLVVAMLGLAVGLNFNLVNQNSGSSDSIDIDNGDTKIDWDNYEKYEITLDGSYNITASGTYHLTGEIINGGVSVRLPNNGVVKLILDNVSIKNSDGPAIACYSGDDLVIEFVGENQLEDGTSYNSSYNEDVKGAIYSKADLTFVGDGVLNLKANLADGIVSKDDLKFDGGTYNITAKDDAIRGKDSVYIKNGDFVIAASQDGIKSTNEKETSKGFVLIEGGSLQISAGDDGITAYNKLIVDGGTIDILKSREGLEAQKIILNGGDISIFANDDGINASGSASTSSNNPFEADEGCVISINGGNLYVNAAGDGIDSNGYLYINGGSVIVDGPTNSGNGALDAGAGIVINGGSVLAIGASGMAESLGDSSSVYNISVFFTSTFAKDTKIEIKNSAGETILSHTSAKTFNHLAAGSTEFELGESYTIYINGAEYSTFTISNVTTILGNSGHGGMNGPGNTNGPGDMNGPRG